MSRSFSTNFGTAISNQVVEVFFAVYLDFASGPVGMWSGYGDITIDGNTFIGVGSLMNVSTVDETTELEAKGASITLSGISSTYLSLALQEPYQGREATIYFGVTLSTGAREFVEIFSGELDQMNILEASDTATIQVTVENSLIKLERPIIRRFTDEDQKTRFPTDDGFKFVAGLQNKEIYWGRKAS